MKALLITSSVLILLITAVRFLFRNKISRRLQYALWGLVLLRLLLPVSLPASPMSVLSAAQAFETRWQEQHSPISNITLPPADLPAPENPAQPAVPVPPEPEKTDVLPLLRGLWLGGIAVLGLWFLLTNLHFLHRLKKSRTPLETAAPIPVYLTEQVVSPCLFGLFRPAIYLTPRAIATEESLQHVLTHELCHWRHKDHWISALRCLCLAVYWFDPLVWLAAFLSKADGELACDESVIRILGSEQRLAYGKTLLDMIAPGRNDAGILCTATTMVSGKKPLRHRLQRIAKNKKPLIWAAAFALLVAAIGVGCTFTSPKMPPEQDEKPAVILPEEPASPADTLDAAVRAAVLSGRRVDAGQFPAESHHILKVEETEETTTVYLVCLYLVYSSRDGVLLQDGVGGSMPMVLTFARTESGYTLKNRWEPLGGEGYAAEIREKFPDEIENTALDFSAYSLSFNQDTYRQANRHFGIDPTAQIADAIAEITECTIAAGVHDYRILDHRAVLYNGDWSVRYILSEFLKGEQPGAREMVLWTYLCAVYPGEVAPLESPFVSYRHSFDQWKDYVLLLAEKNGAGFFASNRTATCLLTLLGKHTPQQPLVFSRTVTGGDHGIARDGDSLTYEISVTNASSVDRKNISVVDRVGEHAGISSIDGVLVNGPTEPVWSLDIPAGQTKTVSYRVKVGGKPGDVIYSHGGTVAGQPMEPLTTHIVAGAGTTLRDIAAAPMSGDASIGVGVRLCYADKEKIVFYGYFGVYVYDLKKEQITMGIDLQKAVGTNAIQGSDPAAADVSADGQTLRLSRISDSDSRGNALWISLSDGSVRFGPWAQMDVFVPTLYQENALLGGTLGTLTYEAAGKQYRIFEN